MNAAEVKALLATYNLHDVAVVFNKPFKSERNVAFANTKDKVGHWVAVEFNEHGESLLVDSYGLDNDEAYDVPYLNDPDYFNVTRGQQWGTPYCGLYAVAYHSLRRRGLTWEQACAKLFPDSSETRDNEPVLAKVLGFDPDTYLADLGHIKGVGGLLGHAAEACVIS